jgi:hypothetical protein
LQGPCGVEPSSSRVAVVHKVGICGKNAVGQDACMCG